MVVLGFAYALGAASMWPLLSQIVPANMVSTGYGTMTAVQNLGLAVFPLIISSIQQSPSIVDSPHRYGVPIVIFVLCVFVASVLAVFLYFLDRDQFNGKLNASATERAFLAKQLEEEPEIQ